ELEELGDERQRYAVVESHGPSIAVTGHVAPAREQLGHDAAVPVALRFGHVAQVARDRGSRLGYRGHVVLQQRAAAQRRRAPRWQVKALTATALAGVRSGRADPRACQPVRGAR